MEKITDRDWMLVAKARLWRFLMAIGMLFHKVWTPRPMSANFSRWIPSTLSSFPGRFKLTFYLPPGYEGHRRQGFRNVRNGAGYPVVLVLHGGGFTIGTSTDDVRFVTAATSQLECVAVSVDYRLAPEYPFPVAVEDCADAVLWLADHAEQLGIDPHSLAIAGFSSGGNLTLTTPVRIHDHINGFKRRLFTTADDDDDTDLTPPPSQATSSISLLKHPQTTLKSVDGGSSSLSLAPTLTNEPSSHRPSSRYTTRSTPPSHIPSFTIRALVPFYPSTNYTLTRAQRRATNPNPKHDIPPMLTNLFDDSYLPSPALRRGNPYLSPGRMSAQDLRDVYADASMTLIACEWDMLCAEAAEFVTRLRAARAGAEGAEGEDLSAPQDELERGVGFAIVKGAAHAWDKKPFLNREKLDGIAREYDFVFGRLKEVFAVER